MKYLKIILPYFILTILCILLYLPGIVTIPLDDRDSAHFVQATRQMMETGNYFQIRYQETTRYQKPPGINWLQALSVKIFSTFESKEVWPYRIPSFVGGWLSVILTFAFAKHFCGRTIAFIASIILASTMLLNVESHLAVIDTSLLFFVILMQGSLWVVYKQVLEKSSSRIHWIWGLLFFLSMAFGFLLKGVTPLVGLLTLLALSFIDRTTLYFKALHWKWGLLLFFLLSGAWLTALSLAEQSNYLMHMFNRDLLPKLVGGHESHGAPLGTHFALLLITFWPASLFLWPMLVRTWTLRLQPLEKFLLAWIIPTWIFFEIMPTKLPQYILPAFPALAILTAYAIVDETAKNNRVTRILAFIWGMFSLLLAFIFIAIPLFLHLTIHFFSAAIWTTVVLIITSITAVVLMFKKNDKRNYLKVFYVLILGNLLGVSPVYQYFLPKLTPIWSSQIINETIDRQLSKIQVDHANPLLVIGYSEPSLVFLLGTSSIRFHNTETIIKELLSKEKKHQYVLINDDFQKEFILSIQSHEIQLKFIESVTSFNYNKGRWIYLTLYVAQSRQPITGFITSLVLPK